MGAETTDGTARPRIAFGDGPWAPTVDPATVAGLCGLDDPAVLLGWTVEELPWLEAMPPGRGTSVSAGYRLGKAIPAGGVGAGPAAIPATPAPPAGGSPPRAARRPVGVRVRSGMVTDALVRLERRGLLLDRAETTYAWGGDDLAALSAGGRLRLVPSDESHDVDRLAAFEQFTAVNSALEVGLDGAVNVERPDGRAGAGIGGPARFFAPPTRPARGPAVVAPAAPRRAG